MVEFHYRWTSLFRLDGYAQGLGECSALLECTLAHVECTDLGQSLFDRFAFLINLLIAQRALGLFLKLTPHFDHGHCINFSNRISCEGGVCASCKPNCHLPLADAHVLGSHNHFNCTLTNVGATISAPTLRIG